MISRIGIGKITSGFRTAFGAIQSVRLAFVPPKFFTTLEARNKFAAYLSFAGAFMRAILRLDRWEGRVFPMTVLAYSSNHKLNCTALW